MNNKLFIPKGMSITQQWNIATILCDIKLSIIVKFPLLCQVIMVTISLIVLTTIRIRKTVFLIKEGKIDFPTVHSRTVKVCPRTSFRVTFCMIYIELQDPLSPYISVPNLEWSRSQKGKSRDNSFFDFDKRWFLYRNKMKEINMTYFLTYC